MEVTRTSTQQANEAASVCEAIAILTSRQAGQNMVRESGEYEAESVGNALARAELGESGRGQGRGVGQQLSGKITGTSYHPKGNKATIIITMLDKSSRSADGKAFGYRSRTVFDATDPSRNMKTLEVCQNFKTWEPVDLTGKPGFPGMDSEQLRERIKTELIRLQAKGMVINILVKKADYLKKKVDKADGIEAADGSKAVYEAFKGNTDKITTADGESLPSVKREVFRIQLAANLPAPRIEDLYPDWTEFIPKALVKSGKNKGNVKKGTDQFSLISEIEMLPLYLAEIETLRDDYATAYAIIRPFELGVIERARDSEGETFPETATIDGEVFEIEINTDTEYDQPLDTAEKIKTGEYVKVSVPTTGGRWKVVPAPVPQTA